MLRSLDLLARNRSAGGTHPVFRFLEWMLAKCRIPLVEWGCCFATVRLVSSDEPGDPIDLGWPRVTDETRCGQRDGMRHHVDRSLFLAPAGVSPAQDYPSLTASRFTLLLTPRSRQGLPTIVLGLTMRSKSAAETPRPRAASRRLVPSLSAFWAMAEALS
jgi:hypothetical protein